MACLRVAGTKFSIFVCYVVLQVRGWQDGISRQRHLQVTPSVLPSQQCSIYVMILTDSTFPHSQIQTALMILPARHNIQDLNYFTVLQATSGHTHVASMPMLV